MKLIRSSALLFVLLVAFRCAGPSPSWEGIDWTAWKNDRNGCLHLRESALLPLKRQVNKLKGLSEMEIVDLMGRPDRNELYKRNQKFYYYWIVPGEPCGKPTESGTKLTLRFNAVGKAKEVSID